MTDAEIIKAYEDKVDLIASMTSVYLDEEDGFNLYEVMKNTLDLINRQKAEIERLTINMNAFGLGMKREKERADNAIKEFAERLKEECSFECDVSLGYGRPCYEDAVPIIAIDNLVKEMAGETE